MLVSLLSTSCAVNNNKWLTDTSVTVYFQHFEGFEYKMIYGTSSNGVISPVVSKEAIKIRTDSPYKYYYAKLPRLYNGTYIALQVFDEYTQQRVGLVCLTFDNHDFKRSKKIYVKYSEETKNWFVSFEGAHLSLW